MPLIERETVLASRRDEIASKERAAQLAVLVAAQQGQSKRTKAKAGKGKPVRSKAKSGSDMDESSEEEDDEEDEDEDEDDYGGPGTSRKGRVRKSVGTTDTRNRKLQELSENRRKKAAARRSSRKGDDDDDDDAGAPRSRKQASASSDEESDESEGYVESDDEDRRRRRGIASGSLSGKDRQSRRQREDEGPYVAPELDDLNRARIGRRDISRVMYRKGWEDALVGSFVRVVTDPQRDDRTGKMVQRYRAYEIVDWRHGSRYYAADEGKYTNVLLILAFAKGEKHEKMVSIVSNSDITADEAERYKMQAQVAVDHYERVRSQGGGGRRGLQLAQSQAHKPPSKSQVLERADEWQDYINEVWSEEDFTMVLKAKKEAKRLAEEQGAVHRNGEVRGSPNINGGSRPSPMNGQTGSKPSEDVLLAELNERNRKQDRIRIQDAQRKQAEARRLIAQKEREVKAAAATAAAQTDDVNGQNQSRQGAATSSEKSAAAPQTSTADVDIDLGDF